MISNFSDILAYHSQSRAVEQDPQLKTIGEDILSVLETSVRRWPVRNKEPRRPISSQKRAIIHERDGGSCRYCGNTGLLVLDHIIPRSAFRAKDLWIADRSDNLQSACWDCNDNRSNYETVFQKRLGVTDMCFWCANPEYEPSSEVCADSPSALKVFCGRCGVSSVPSLDWIF